ncbi:DUF6401 family natural product biosynthesis protein [Amycolatopsis sp. GM8]|uniref:DUF6401 family natural product biosynthesis protein n=1 Tax=Amycolatopsis sp. GM8 TaxID=2896530 RepID=UPI001F4484AB|nr:DUF6401 family natural product biosynthesis protein [Amycolatopsis sp. GM8]
MGWADTLADRSARRWFETIAGRIEPGWSALSADPALWSRYEHHLAAVTDAVHVEGQLVGRQEPVSDLVLIASHAHDVWTAAEKEGWTPPSDAARWAPSEWTGLRLLACFRLAAAEPHGPKLSREAALLRRTTAEPRKRVR